MGWAQCLWLNIFGNLKSSQNSGHFATSGSPMALFVFEISPLDPESKNQFFFENLKSPKKSDGFLPFDLPYDSSLTGYCQPEFCDGQRWRGAGIAYSSSWIIEWYWIIEFYWMNQIFNRFFSSYGNDQQNLIKSCIKNTSWANKLSEELFTSIAGKSKTPR